MCSSDLHNPVLLAEQVATIDVLSGGRVDFGIGRGYRKAEFDQFCVPMSEAWDRYNECVEIMLKAWRTDGRFSYHSSRWNFEDIVVEPAPVQRPHPPIWTAAGSTESIARVASENYNLLLDQIAPIDQTISRVQLYLDGLEAKGLPRDASRVGVTRALHIVRNDAERKEAYERRRQSLQKIGELARTVDGRRPTFDDAYIAADDSALIGSPDEIVGRLQRLADGGVEYILLTNAMASAESLDVLAEEILPRVRSKAAPRAEPVAANA